MGHLYYTCPENFRSRWPQVRSPSHEKRYNARSKFQFSLCTRPTHSFWPISFKLTGCAKFTELYDISSVFVYCWPEVSGRSRPRDAEPIGKLWNSSDPENTRYICFISSLLCFTASICSNTSLSFSLWDVLIQAWGQIRSTEVKWRFCQYLVTE